MKSTSAAGVVHPLLDQNGPLKIPESAIPAAMLASRPMAKRGTLVKSEKIFPSWAGQDVFLGLRKGTRFFHRGSSRWEIPVQVRPCDRRGFFPRGCAIGRQGNRIRSIPRIRGVFRGAATPGAVSLTKGRHEISLVAKRRRRAGLLFFETKPVYQDIVANRWMIAGPFVVAEKEGPEADAAIAEAVKSQVFPPGDEPGFLRRHFRPPPVSKNGAAWGTEGFCRFPGDDRIRLWKSPLRSHLYSVSGGKRCGGIVFH